MKEFNFEKELLGVQDELFRFAYKLTANREKAEDL
ncbi:RNA polymerase sigma factor, partial [Parabacteroides distasonis]|nr:RNA polymerase sigma factor [Parabacteroides distasonis]